MDKLQTLRNRLNVVKERNILREQYLEEGLKDGLKKVGKGIAKTAVIAGMLGSTGHAVVKDHIAKDKAKDLEHSEQILQRDENLQRDANERFKDHTGKEYTVDFNLDDAKGEQTKRLGKDAKDKADAVVKSNVELENNAKKLDKSQKKATAAGQIAVGANVAGLTAGALALKHKFNKFKKKRKADRQVSRFS